MCCRWRHGEHGGVFHWALISQPLCLKQPCVTAAFGLPQQPPVLLLPLLEEEEQVLPSTQQRSSRPLVAACHTSS